MTDSTVHVVVPGLLEQRTGGYIYDARIVSGLRDLGRTVAVHDLPGRFPDADATARTALDAALRGIGAGSTVVIDGLALGGLPDLAEGHAERLRILALVHHPLADETGLCDAEAARLRAAERRALAACAGVVVTSGYTARRLSERYAVPADRIRVIPPGTRPAPLARGPGPGEPPALLCVATVTPRKGHDVLVRALSEIRDLEWRCVCVGSLERDPGHAGRVRETVSELGLSDRVRFPGERPPDRLGALYDAASLFVLASHYEGYGMALAEALARGLPVVSTTGGAIPFTVPKDAGLLVEPGDEAGLAAALRSLLGGAATRAALAAAARRHAAGLPTWEDSVRLFARALEEWEA